MHSRQVSFPGGQIEPQDSGPEQTALRETEEEIGVRATDITVIGKLSNIYIPPSDFFVFPFVGAMHRRPHFQPDVHEVDMLIESPLSDIFLPASKGSVRIERQDVSFDAPCYFIGGETVWGATAIILSELEDILLSAGFDQ
ncbi:MAG: CoA pyrophosphatase [Chitinophagales bacterium]